MIGAVSSLPVENMSLSCLRQFSPSVKKESLLSFDLLGNNWASSCRSWAQIGTTLQFCWPFIFRPAGDIATKNRASFSLATWLQTAAAVSCFVHGQHQKSIHCSLALSASAGSPLWFLPATALHNNRPSFFLLSLIDFLLAGSTQMQDDMQIIWRINKRGLR